MKTIPIAALLMETSGWVTLLIFIGAGVAAIFGGYFFISYILIPLPRYLALRIALLFKCIFSKAKFSPVGFLSHIFPHFNSDKPDYFLFSGNKLYMVKLKTYRKLKKKVVFLSEEKWQTENMHDTPSSFVNHPFFHNISMKSHKIKVNKREVKAPKLYKYATKINKALATEGVDCIPLILFSPGPELLHTARGMDMINGDVTFYGVVVAKGFYPQNLEKPDLGSSDVNRILKIAKKQLRKGR